MSVSAVSMARGQEAQKSEAARASLMEAFRQVADGLYRLIVIRLGGDRTLADDLMQQVWMEASRSCASSEVQDWEAWLRGIARNLCRQHWRSVACRPQGVPLADPVVAAQVADLLDRSPLPPELLARREVQDQVLLALTLLPAADQALIIRHHFRGESQASIAQDLQSTIRAVEGRLYRARRALRECLAELKAED